MQLAAESAKKHPAPECGAGCEKLSSQRGALAGSYLMNNISR